MTGVSIEALFSAEKLLMVLSDAGGDMSGRLVCGVFPSRSALVLLDDDFLGCISCERGGICKGETGCTESLRNFRCVLGVTADLGESLDGEGGFVRSESSERLVRAEFGLSNREKSFHDCLLLGLE